MVSQDPPVEEETQEHQESPVKEDHLVLLVRQDIQWVPSPSSSSIICSISIPIHIDAFREQLGQQVHLVQQESLEIR